MAGYPGIVLPAFVQMIFPNNSQWLLIIINGVYKSLIVYFL